MHKGWRGFHVCIILGHPMDSILSPNYKRDKCQQLPWFIYSYKTSLDNNWWYKINLNE